MKVYTLELDGKIIKLESDHEPTEDEVRAALGPQRDPNAPPPMNAPPPSDTEIMDQQAAARAQRGPVARALEPVAQMVESAASAPRQALATIQHPLDAIRAGAEPFLNEARKGQAAFDRGGVGGVAEGLARVATASSPVGPAISQAAETLGSGNVAGAASQAALLASMLADVPKFMKPSAVAKSLEKQAQARLIAAERPGPKFVEKAVGAAGEVLHGTSSLESKLPGIGHGNLETMAKRAQARRRVAGQERGMLENISEPIDVAPAVAGMRERAAKLETVVPGATTTEVREVPTGVLNASGQPITRSVTQDVTTPERVTSKDPALASAIRTHADRLAADAQQFIDAGDAGYPAGELFKQQRVVGKVAGKKYKTEPGSPAATAADAGAAYYEEVSTILKDQLPDIPVAEVNRAYEVWNSAAVNFRRARRAELSGQGWAGLKDLLVGRLAGNVARQATMGAAAGGMLGGVAGGTAGALAGVMLGRSTFWNTLRAERYSQLADLLNRGDVNGAASILMRAESAFAVNEAVKERERNLRAQRALRNSAEGVIAP